jgi:hypothetical protein
MLPNNIKYWIKGMNTDPSFWDFGGVNAAPHLSLLHHRVSLVVVGGGGGGVDKVIWGPEI